jgi:cell division protein FtsB
MTPRSLIFSLYLLLFAGMTLAAGLFFLDAREEYERLKSVQAEDRQRLSEAQARLDDEEKVLERLRTDPDYVERVIRRKLGYAKPNEYIFRFEDH